MIPFDLYRPAGTRSKGFFDGPVHAASVVGLDGAGFTSGYFKTRQTQELLSFAVLPANSDAIPTDARAFENLSFVEAEVGEHDDESSKVTIRSVQAIGEWARRTWLPSKAGFDMVPAELKPPAEVLASLREALRSKESVVWVADPASAGPVVAMCLIKCDSDRRALVLCNPTSTSYLVRL
jgi:hypothetical protein